MSPTRRDFVYWFGKHLAAAGLLKNETWVVEHVREAYDIGDPMGLGWIASCMACSHPRAIDYIRQAPLLAVGAYKRELDTDAAEGNHTWAGGGGSYGITLSKKAYLNIASDIHMMCQHKYNLRQVHKFYQVSPHLRQIKQTLHTRRRIDIFWYLSMVPPETLSQVIPDSMVKQREFLERVNIWSQNMARKHINLRPRDLGLPWLLKNLLFDDNANNRNIFDVGDLESLGDFYISEQFNPRWHLRRAYDEMRLWHDREVEEKQLGPNADQVIPYPITKSITVDGYIITPLNTYRKQWAEGKTMHHCLATYATTAGRSFFFHLRGVGGEESTLELLFVKTDKSLIPYYLKGQHRGSHNSFPSQKAESVVDKFRQELNKKLKEEMQKRQLK